MHSLLFLGVGLIISGARQRDGWVIACGVLAILFTFAPRVLPPLPHW